MCAHRKKRVTVFANGRATNGKVLFVPKKWNDFLARCSRKLGLPAPVCGRFFFFFDFRFDLRTRFLRSVALCCVVCALACVRFGFVIAFSADRL